MHQFQHFHGCLTDADEDCPRYHRMSDIQLANVGNRGNGLSVVVIQPMTSIDLDTEAVSLEPTVNCATVLPKKSDESDGRWMWGKEKCKNENQRLQRQYGSQRRLLNSQKKALELLDSLEESES